MRLGRLANSSTRKDVRPLTEAAAIDLGSEIVGEMFIFGVASGIVLREYAISSAKSAAKEEKLQALLKRMQGQLRLLEGRVEAVSLQVGALEQSLSSASRDKEDGSAREA